MKKINLRRTVLATILIATTSISINAQKKQRVKIEGKSLKTIEKFKEKNWEMESIFTTSFGYAVFPSIVKAGAGIGGARGKGILYQQGEPVGELKITQVSIGYQLGGQSYSEVVFFKNEEAFELFKSNRLKLAAQASAVFVTAGISKDIPYNNGVAIYTLPKGGVMYEAAVGGQKFKYSEIYSN
jgi:lipid-binding SYLF domain-containing protein